MLSRCLTVVILLSLLSNSLANGFSLSELTSPDGSAYAFFGFSVSVSGNLVAVGAANKNVGYSYNRGEAYLFDCTDPVSCVPLTAIISSDGAQGDQFGNSVSISGSLVAVGAPVKTVGSNSQQGEAYLYDCTNPASCVEYKIFASDGAQGDQFGYSVSISGNLVAVGAPGKNNGQGESYLYDCTNPASCVEHKMLASDGAQGDQFGYSISISGSIVMVGAPLKTVGSNPQQGKAYLYDCTTNLASCVEHKVLASDGSGGDRFGNSVSLFGSLAAVGAPLKTVRFNPQQGESYLYDCTTSLVACVEHKILASDGAQGDQFGYSVSISGGLVMVGAPFKTVGSNPYQGEAYLYDCADPVACVEHEIIASDGADSDRSGHSVSISGNRFVVAAPFKAVQSQTNMGAAYVGSLSAIECLANTFAHAKWPKTPFGKTATGTCQTGYGSGTNTPTRSCSLDGVWASEVSDECYRLSCPAENSGTGNADWPSAASGGVFYGTCTAGHTRNPYLPPPTRLCYLDGTWSSIVLYSCV